MENTYIFLHLLLQRKIIHINLKITVKENNSPFENLKDEYKMLLLRDRIRQNKRIKRVTEKNNPYKEK